MPPKKKTTEVKALSKFDAKMDKICQDITREVLGEDAVKGVIEGQQSRRRFEQWVVKMKKNQVVVELLSKAELHEAYDRDTYNGAHVVMSPIINYCNYTENMVEMKRISNKWMSTMAWYRWHGFRGGTDFHKKRKYLERVLGKPCDYTGYTSGRQLYKIWGLKVNGYPMGLSICNRGTGMDVPLEAQKNLKLVEMFIDVATTILKDGRMP